MMPEEFYKAEKPRVTAKTVGELIAALEKLPSEMTMSHRHEVIVYNFGHSNVHFAIEECIFDEPIY